MGSKNNNALFYTCSLIEFIGRTVKRKREEVTDYLGKSESKEFTSMRMYFTVSRSRKQRMNL